MKEDGLPIVDMRHFLMCGERLNGKSHRRFIPRRRWLDSQPWSSESALERGTGGWCPGLVESARRCMGGDTRARTGSLDSTLRSGVVDATEQVPRSPDPRGWPLKLAASPASITRYPGGPRYP